MCCAALMILCSALSPWSSPELVQDPNRQDAASICRNSIESVVLVANEGAGFSGIGTGFVVYDSSTIATAWHVIKDAETITVTFSDGTAVDVEGVVSVDRARDVALLRIRKTSRRPLAIRADDPEIGEKVFAIGNPRGLEFSVSDGIISQIREYDGNKHYQYSIPVTHGNSGGPILDAQGRVVGLVTFGYKGESALNFATPAMALDELSRDGELSPMPATVSGTVAWRFEKQVIDAPRVLAGRNELLLITGARFMTLELRSGLIKRDVLVPTKYMPKGFTSNSDGSTIVIRHGSFRLAILHRDGDEEYTKREYASGLWNSPLISEDGRVFNIGGTLGEDGSLSNIRLEAIAAASDGLLWSVTGTDISGSTGPGRRMMLLRSQHLVFYDESFDTELIVYDAGTGDRLWKSERLRIPVGSPLGLIYYNTSNWARAVAYDPRTGKVGSLPPIYLRAANASTGEIVYSLEGKFGRISVGPDGIVYLSDGGDLIAMNAELSVQKWRTTIGSSVSHLAAFDNEGSMFVTLKDGRLIAIDAETGRQRWSYSGGEGWYFTGQVSVEAGLVVAKTTNGGFLVIHD